MKPVGSLGRIGARFFRRIAEDKDFFTLIRGPRPPLLLSVPVEQVFE
jgi:hypothetical protein